MSQARGGFPRRHYGGRFGPSAGKHRHAFGLSGAHRKKMDQDLAPGVYKMQGDFLQRAQSPEIRLQEGNNFSNFFSIIPETS